jgi:hypothetical protein
MSLSDFLSSPNLFFLGIVLAIIGGISMFFMQRLSEQNHKIVSMMGLVSTMAEELNYFKNTLYSNSPQNLQNKETTSNVSHTFLNSCSTNSLIEVSDDSGSESGSESDSESGSESESESESESDSNENDKTNVIKIVNMDDNMVNDELNIKFENVHISDESIPFSETSSENNDDLDDILEESLDELNINKQEPEQEQEQEQEYSKAFNFMKNVNLSSLEDDDTKNESSDYKKMSITMLRSIVVGKKLTEDASKMKKNEILKLLDPNTSSDKSSTIVLDI